METVIIKCRCKNCTHSVFEHHSYTEGKKWHCYFWDYERGMSPNVVDENGFCSNAEKE